MASVRKHCFYHEAHEEHKENMPLYQSFTFMRLVLFVVGYGLLDGRWLMIARPSLDRQPGKFGALK